MKKLILAALVILTSSITANSDEHSHQAPSAAAGGLKTDFAGAPVKQGPYVPNGAKVFFKNLAEGQTITKKYLVKFGVRKMKVHPAGELQDGTGHYHIIINEGPVAAGIVVPADENHIHFGKAQTEYELNLKPGQYKLTLQFADGTHVSYGPELAETVSVTVK